MFLFAKNSPSKEFIAIKDKKSISPGYDQGELKRKINGLTLSGIDAGKIMQATIQKKLAPSFEEDALEFTVLAYANLKKFLPQAAARCSKEQQASMKNELSAICLEIDKIIAQHAKGGRASEGQKALTTKLVNAVAGETEAFRLKYIEDDKDWLLLGKHLWIATLMAYFSPMTSPHWNEMISAANNIDPSKDDDILLQLPYKG